MKDYIILVVSVSLGTALLKGVFPVLYEKYSVSFAVKLLAVIIALSPIIKNAENFLNLDSSVVINQENEHNIDNEDGEMIWKKALAENTALTLSQEIENQLIEDLGIYAVVIAPWSVKDGNIVFEKLKIYPECSEDKFERIENYIRIHYRLDSVCEKDKYAENKE